MIRTVIGDITKMDVDAIVNAANNALAPGGGVCGAIHRAAGPELATACRAIAPCDTGDARITEGYGLPARYVIHAVGPVWRGGGEGEAEQLGDCYRRSLDLADQRQLTSIAFPAISTGIFGYPVSAAADVAARTIRAWTDAHPQTTIRDILLVCFSDSDRAAFAAAAAENSH